MGAGYCLPGSFDGKEVNVEDANVAWARSLTDGALADRLLKAADSIRFFNAAEREALLRESAHRLQAGELALARAEAAQRSEGDEVRHFTGTCQVCLATDAFSLDDHHRPICDDCIFASVPSWIVSLGRGKAVQSIGSLVQELVARGEDKDLTNIPHWRRLKQMLTEVMVTELYRQVKR